MKNALETVMCFRFLVFLLVATAILDVCVAEQQLITLGRPYLSRGRETNDIASVNEIALSSTEEAFLALRRIKDGQVLHLDLDEISLQHKVIVGASNILIVGAEPVTRVICPPDGDAFFVKGRNVTFARLEFSQCSNGSALHVNSGQSALEQERENWSRWDRNRQVTKSDTAATENSEQWSCSQDANSRDKPCVIVVDSSFLGNRAYEGAAIQVTEAKVVVKNATFVNNKATNGAALFSHRSEVFIRDSKFASNRAKKQGGAIFVGDGSHLTIKSSSFKKNSADDAGGAIKLQKRSTLTTTDSTFEENWTDKFEGGAVVGYVSSLTFIHTSFTNNSAQGNGGGISLYKNSILIADSSSFFNNKAKSGGAVMTQRSKAVVKNATFSTNQVRLDGGAFYATVSSVVTVELSSFIENVAKFEGGAIKSQKKSDVNITDSVFEQNAANKANGGAIGGVASPLHISASSFTDNFAETAGGAIALSKKSDLWMEKSKFFANSAMEGGALANEDSEADLSWSTFDGNFARSTGGAIIATHGATQKICNSDITNNSAKMFGGAVVALQKASLSVDHSKFWNNSAPESGGAIAGDESELTLSMTLLEDNSAGISGGALHLSKSSLATIERTTFTSNKANHGGAVFGTDESVLKINSCTFLKNKAKRNKAFKESSGKTVNDSQTLVSGTDDFIKASGGALSLSDCELELKNSSLTSNLADVNGGAIRLSGRRTLTIRTTIFSRNLATNRGGAVYMNDDGSLMVVDGAQFTRNSADNGGAVYSSSPSILQMESESGVSTNFTENDAIYGGGLFCDGCTLRLRHPIIFSENIAVEYGGGVYLKNAGSKSSISQGTFDSNVAAFGGGIAIRDCDRLTVGSISGATTTFRRNVALVGGAVHFELQRAEDSKYSIQNCRFQANKANRWRTMTANPSEGAAVERWNMKLEKAQEKEILKHPRCDDCAYGIGGGFYIRVHELIAGGRACVVFHNIAITDNEAADGGDVVIANLNRRASFTSLVFPNEQTLCFE